MRFLPSRLYSSYVTVVAQLRSVFFHFLKEDGGMCCTQAMSTRPSVFVVVSSMPRRAPLRINCGNLLPKTMHYRQPNVRTQHI